MATGEGETPFTGTTPDPGTADLPPAPGTVYWWSPLPTRIATVVPLEAYDCPSSWTLQRVPGARPVSTNSIRYGGSGEKPTTTGKGAAPATVRWPEPPELARYSASVPAEYPKLPLASGTTSSSEVVERFSPATSTHQEVPAESPVSRKLAL